MVNTTADGKLAKLGLLDSEASKKIDTLIKKVKAGSLETIRVLFADQHGLLRGKTLTNEAFCSAMKNGVTVPSTLLFKDTSQRTVFPVWEKDGAPLHGVSDILLAPDPDTFHELPWSPHSAWIFCDVKSKSGVDLPFCSRSILKRAIDKLSDSGLVMNVGLEVEFHVYDVIDDQLAHENSGMPSKAPETRNLASGYQLLGDQEYGKLESVMDLLRRNCQQIGMRLSSTEVEMGPSQFEFTFEPDDPLRQADTMMRFRALVKAVCAKQGLHASFMCKPKLANSAACGWHLHQSIESAETGENLFTPKQGEKISELAGNWIAGLLTHARETCLLTTPTVNGYKRYQPFQLAPDRIQWGEDNRGAMIRVLASPDDKSSRLENRIAEPAANPYLFFASQIFSGLSGIAHGLKPPLPVETPYDGNAEKLPDNLMDAIIAFEKSDLLQRELGSDFVSYLSVIKRAEWQRYLSQISQWEQDEYFSVF